MLAKVRPNVLVAMVCGAILTGVFGYMLIGAMGDPDVGKDAVTVLGILVGIGVGGIFTLAGSMAQDPPPPNYPAGPMNEHLDRVMTHVETMGCPVYCETKDE